MRIALLPFALPLLLLTACISAPGPGGSSSSSVTSSIIASSSASSATSKRFQDPGIGYSISVPSGWTTVKNKEVTTELYQAKGTAFIAPVATGTTLDEAFFHIAQMTSCPSLPQNTSVIIGGVSFQRAPWNGAGAGNLYEGVAYAGPKNDSCLVLTGYLHSCNLGSDCGTNHSAPFKKDTYLSAFDAMARSVQFLTHLGD